MGTSKDYEAPSTPQWGELKSDITREAKEGRPTSDNAQNIISKYIKSNGGARSIGNGQGIVGGKSAVSVARNIANFSSLINQYGVRETFRLLNLGGLQGKDIFEITNTLIDYFSDSSSTIDDVDARNALTTLLDELFEDNEENIGDSEAIEDIFQRKFNIEDVNNHFSKFFAYYLYEQFCRVFYERLVTRVGEDQASSFLDGIKDYLISQVDSLHYDKDLTSIDWGGQEGQIVTAQMLEQTLYIFGGE